MSNIFSPSKAHFKVIGVGGAGCQMVSRIAGSQIPPPSFIEYIAMDTNTQDLALADVANRIQLGGRLLHGLDSGNDPAMGRRAAEESRGVIRQAIMDSHIVIILASLGGGTAAGAAPVIAEMAHRTGVLTIGMVTTPFAFEGARRMETAQQGVTALMRSVDSLFVMPQDLTAAPCDGKADVGAVLQVPRDLMAKGIEMLNGAFYSAGMINLDFADLNSILKDSGLAEFSVGCASGEDRGAQAAYAALANPALGSKVKKAKAALFTATGGSSLTLYEVNSAADVIRNEVDPNSNILFAVHCDDTMGDEMKIALIVTKFAGAENSGLRGDGK